MQYGETYPFIKILWYDLWLRFLVRVVLRTHDSCTRTWTHQEDLYAYPSAWLERTLIQPDTMKENGFT